VNPETVVAVEIARAATDVMDATATANAVTVKIAQQGNPRHRVRNADRVVIVMSAMNVIVPVKRVINVPTSPLIPRLQVPDLSRLHRYKSRASNSNPDPPSKPGQSIKVRRVKVAGAGAVAVVAEVVARAASREPSKMARPHCHRRRIIRPPRLKTCRLQVNRHICHLQKRYQPLPQR